MPQINDVFFQALRDAGYTGALADMRRAWMQANGYNTMRDAAVDLGWDGVGSLTDFLLARFQSGPI